MIFLCGDFFPSALNSKIGGENAGRRSVRPTSFDYYHFVGVFSFGEVREKKQGFSMSGRKETALDLAKFVDKGVQVKLTGGRQVSGTLKGYDQLLNLVLDEAIESLRDPDDPLKTTDQTRRLGLIVCRGTAVMLVSPTDGTDEIANPFIQPEGA
ncbi:sm-like protein LSM7 isoform X1 [Phalaenopsis equestris]|nr:sm-like protein LSM7 isoform X1 [Phalaenopsis equestris]